MKRGLPFLILSAVCALILNGCFMINLQHALDTVGKERPLVAQNNAKSARDLIVYRLDDNYYMQLDLKFMKEESGLLVWSGWGNHSAAIDLNTWTKEKLDAAPIETYMVLMNPYSVENSLQVKTEKAPEDTPQLIPIAEFDFAKATRCTPNPKRYTSGDWKGQTYKLEDCYPNLNHRYRYSLLHYMVKPLYWASWGVEIPVFVVTNTTLYAIVMPFELIQEYTTDEKPSEPIEVTH